jgi:oligoribonuclease (3'-5' exoribonuclease)
MRPYVSIDIETTGIDPRSEILQISCVLDDLTSPISSLKTLDLPIKYESIAYSEPYALGMNAELLKKMMNKDFQTVSPSTACYELMEFLGDMYKKNLVGGKPQKIILAGKNVASFDIPRLRNHIEKYTKTLVKDFDKIVHYKTLDVGSLYYDVFKDNVNLSKINELTGRNAVTHNALDDAFDVVYAVRHKLGVKND